MKTRRLHRLLGITLLLPFLAWSTTAIVFLVQPGYDEAYQPLSVRQYPLRETVELPVDEHWEELRYFETILGEHLLVKASNGWRHLNPRTLKEAPYPDQASFARLVEDAISVHPERYGSIAHADGRVVRTSTGVEIAFDWNTMSLRQEGRDTRWINRLYSIHYLQWTGIAVLDRILGIAGLLLLIYLTYTGAMLAFGRGKRRRAVRQHGAEE